MDQNEDQLISRFMSESILQFMERCFGAGLGMLPRECEVILLSMIFHPEENIDIKRIDKESKEFKIYSSLMKAGILAERNKSLQFSSPMACRFYMKSLFGKRAKSNPSSIRELVGKVISGMSASVLRQSVAVDAISQKKQFFNICLWNSLQLIQNQLAPFVLNCHGCILL